MGGVRERVCVGRRGCVCIQGDGGDGKRVGVDRRCVFVYREGVRGREFVCIGGGGGGGGKL